MPSSSTGTTVSNTNAGSTQNTRGKSRRTGTVRGGEASARRRTSARTSWASRPRAAAAGVPRRCSSVASRSAGARWAFRCAASCSAIVERRAERRAPHDRVEHSPDARWAPSGRQLDRLEGCAARADGDADEVDGDGKLGHHGGVGAADTPASHRGAEYPSDHRDPRPAIEPDGHVARRADRRRAAGSEARSRGRGESRRPGA